MEFNKQDVIERMQDSDYVKAHREHSKLVEKIDVFLAKKGEHIAAFINAKNEYRNKVDSISAFLQLQSLQADQTPESRKSTLKQVEFLLMKVNELKEHLMSVKDEYKDMFDIHGRERKLLELQQIIEDNSLENISLPRGRQKKRSSKKIPIRNTVSLPKNGIPASGGFR